MRVIPDELTARIESGAAGLCHAWIVTPKSGARLGFTDHDRALTVDGVSCSAASGWTGGARESEVGSAAGTATALGALDDEALSDAAIAGGLLDGAGVELWRVDWSAPELRVRLWAGTVARIVRAGEGFTAEIEGPLAKLERVVGRTYGRMCDAVLGDARCGATVEPGQVCDKWFETCAGVFGNGANFRGFPFIPGDDFIAATPVSGGRHDGGKR